MSKNLILLLLLFLTSIISCVTHQTETLKGLDDSQLAVEELNKFINAKMEQYQIPGLGVAIINDGDIAYRQNFGVKSIADTIKIDEQTIFEAASLSKPLFAYFVMKQVDKGLLDLDTPLYKYIDYHDIVHDKRYKLITARMVLSHVTGLPNWRNGQLNFLFTPGTKYEYSGEGFQYLARAIAKVNKVDREGLFEIFRQDVVLPLNAKRLYFNWNKDTADHKATGHKNGKVGSNGPSDFRTKEFGSAHNLHTDVESYARFITAMISGEGLTESTYREMLKSHVSIPEEDYEKSVLGNTEWSLGFGVKPTSNGKMYSHGGNNGFFTAYTIFYPEKKFGMVIFSNSEKVMFSNFTNELTAFLKTDLNMDMVELNRILNNQ